MEEKKMRKLKFWVGTDTMGGSVTALNKKKLRAKIEPFKDNFKGTKISLLEVQYEDNADLAIKMLGSSVASLLSSDYCTQISEYDA